MSAARDDPIMWRAGQAGAAPEPEEPPAPEPAVRRAPELAERPAPEAEVRTAPEREARPAVVPEEQPAVEAEERPAAEAGQPSQPLGRVAVRAAAVCLVVAVVIGAIAYGVGEALPSTYQSSGLIRVAVPSQQGAIDPVVTAANDIASQYAQLASSQPVAALTAARLGVSPHSLSGKISGSTVDAQNLIQVTATGRSASTASARAAAASAALTDYVSGLNGQAGAQYVSRVNQGLDTINRSLGQLTTRLGRDTGAARSADRTAIQSLISQRDQLLGQVARDAASNEPSLQVVNSSTGPNQSSPKPKLYALVAFIVALLVTGRAAFVLSERRGA